MNAATNGSGNGNGAPDLLLEVKNLRKFFPIRQGFLQRVTGQVRAVDDVSFDLYGAKHCRWSGKAAAAKQPRRAASSVRFSPRAAKFVFVLPIMRW